MNIEIRTSVYFDREFRKLSKRYKSLANDFRLFIKELQSENVHGKEVIKGLFKYRMAITSKNKGKSGGARIISNEILLSVDEKTIVLLAIYDKSDRSNIPNSIIKELQKQAGLI